MTYWARDSIVGKVFALQAGGPEFKPQSPFKERWVWWHVLKISAPGKRKWRQADPAVAGHRLHGVFQAREGLSHIKMADEQCLGNNT